MIYEGKQKIWSDYQKEIPDDHYFYVRSCIRQSFFPASEATFLRMTRQELGKDIFETEHHTTCGGIAYHSDTSGDCDDDHRAPVRPDVKERL